MLKTTLLAALSLLLLLGFAPTVEARGHHHGYPHGRHRGHFHGHRHRRHFWTHRHFRYGHYVRNRHHRRRAGRLHVSFHRHHHWAFHSRSRYHGRFSRHLPFRSQRQHRAFAGSGDGIASWYGGRHTRGSGRFTAAHRFYPMGTRVLVTSRDTGRSVVVQINDRGPFIRGRVIDLSRPAARVVGINGIGRVKLKRL